MSLAWYPNPEVLGFGLIGMLAFLAVHLGIFAWLTYKERKERAT